MKKKAIVIGSTGMVGTQLIQLLLENDQYTEIVSLVRRASKIEHPKLKEHIIDFDQPDKWKELVTGDVLFSTLGTTLAQAKSKENQFKIDYTYQYNVAEIASQNGVSRYVLVSSAGANEKSAAFYMNMKGKLEVAVKHLPFEFISIIQPGPLAGFRKEKRFAEALSIRILKFLNSFGLLRKFKPIDAKIVAQAMINATKTNKSASYSLNEVFHLADM